MAFIRSINPLWLNKVSCHLWPSSTVTNYLESPWLFQEEGGAPAEAAAAQQSRKHLRCLLRGLWVRWIRQEFSPLDQGSLVGCPPHLWPSAEAEAAGHCPWFYSADTTGGYPRVHLSWFSTQACIEYLSFKAWCSPAFINLLYENSVCMHTQHSTSLLHHPFIHCSWVSSSWH